MKRSTRLWCAVLLAAWAACAAGCEKKTEARRESSVAAALTPRLKAAEELYDALTAKPADFKAAINKFNSELRPLSEVASRDAGVDLTDHITTALDDAARFVDPYGNARIAVLGVAEIFYRLLAAEIDKIGSGRRPDRAAAERTRLYFKGAEPLLAPGRITEEGRRPKPSPAYNALLALDFPENVTAGALASQALELRTKLTWELAESFLAKLAVYEEKKAADPEAARLALLEARQLYRLLSPEVAAKSVSDNGVIISMLNDKLGGPGHDKIKAFLMNALKSRPPKKKPGEQSRTIEPPLMPPMQR